MKPENWQQTRPGEVTFSLQEEMKDTFFAAADEEGTEWPVEKTMEGDTRNLKANFCPEGKDSVKVMVLKKISE